METTTRGSIKKTPQIASQIGLMKNLLALLNQISSEEVERIANSYCQESIDDQEDYAAAYRESYANAIKTTKENIESCLNNPLDSPCSLSQRTQGVKIYIKSMSNCLLEIIQDIEEDQPPILSAVFVLYQKILNIIQRYSDTSCRY